MACLYLLEPEVAGELGRNTVFETGDNARDKGKRPVVTKLHYHFSGWLGDDLLEATPCFIVTASLARKIEESNLSGCIFDDVEISLSDEFVELYPGKVLPAFKQMIPRGEVTVDNNYAFRDWSGHDFCITEQAYLIVSEKVLNLLQNHKIENCDITELAVGRGS